ncbi:MAG: hypothetical protein JOZ95_01280 [Solirubrobacterales bacterium]|nr:hypothetical protein [Solirubrobacterales bacterium]
MDGHVAVAVHVAPPMRNTVTEHVASLTKLMLRVGPVGPVAPMAPARCHRSGPLAPLVPWDRPRPSRP